MLDVFDSLAAAHDYRLLLVATGICIFGSVATFLITDRALERRRRLLWLVLTGASGGATVWSTHFIAMVAFQQNLPVTFALGGTLGSLLIGILGVGAGFSLAVRGAARPSWRPLGGLLVGASVVAVHFVGMTALELPGGVSHHAGLIAVSAVLALVFGTLSLGVGLGPGRRRDRPLGIAFFVAMILGLHFTAMSSLELELGAWPAAPGPAVSREVLATLVTAITFMVLAIGFAGALFDKQKALQLQRQADRFRVLSESALEGLVIHKSGRLVDCNAAARALLGLREGETIMLADRFVDLEPEQVEQCLARPIETLMEVALSGAEGRRFTAEIRSRPLQLEDGSAAQVLAIQDVTERKQAEARLHHQALHDALTDLPNRRLFMELAEQIRGHAERHGGQFAVLALDLDGFKMVNDIHGHEDGDRLLVEVARRLESELRDADFLARFGGDEFALVQTTIQKPGEAIRLAERLLARLAEPIRLAASEVNVGTSIGIALYPRDGRRIEELLRNADTAMYRAKAEGKATFRFFEAGMNVALEARRTLETKLRRAIAERTLTVAYQPVIDSRTKATVGFEALARWHDEALGQVSPGDFIPVAEETGLIVQLGELVLEQACAEAARWPTPLRVAVNLSAIQFKRSGLVDTVVGILEKTGLAADRLDLEITESTLIDNREQVLKTLCALKAMGVRISMDDFGTGYSSLSHLQSFPFDNLKIDRSFVAHLGRPHGLSIVKAIAAMGRSLAMTVVAEGVETDAQARQLRDLDCDELQGYLLGRPMTSDDVDAYLSNATDRARAS